MSTFPDQFENLAAKQASSEGVRRLFELLATRATTLQALHNELQKVIVTNRERRSGKTFSFSRRQKRLLSEFQKDAEGRNKELPARIGRLDDAVLLGVALRSEKQQT